MPESHGAFTEALLETLQVLPADAPASLVYQRVKALLEGSGFADQEPDLDANATRRAQPLFGGAAGAAHADKVRTAALKVDDDGSVWLDIGMVSGIGPGSEFTAITTKAGATPVKLRIDKAARRRALQRYHHQSRRSQGPDRRRLRTDSPHPRAVSALRFFVGPANLSTADILAAAAQVKASGVATISDPAEEAYTDVLSWTGTAWTLAKAHRCAAASSHSFFSFEKKKAGPVSLGAAALRRRAQGASRRQRQAMGRPARLHANWRPSSNSPTPNSEAQAADQSSADASYVLAGILVKGDPGYTWFHKNEFATVPHPSRDAGP